MIFYKTLRGKLPQPMLYSYNLGSYWIHSLNNVKWVTSIWNENAPDLTKLHVHEVRSKKVEPI